VELLGVTRIYGRGSNTGNALEFIAAHGITTCSSSIIIETDCVLIVDCVAYSPHPMQHIQQHIVNDSAVLYGPCLSHVEDVPMLLRLAK